MDVEGAIFYWSTTSAGVRRGKISKQDPEDYIVGKPIPTTYPTNNRVGCVACHTVSRNGKYMLAPVQANDPTPRWRLVRMLKSEPVQPVTLPVRDIRVVFGLKSRHYEGFARSQVAHVRRRSFGETLGKGLGGTARRRLESLSGP